MTDHTDPTNFPDRPPWLLSDEDCEALLDALTDDEYKMMHHLDLQLLNGVKLFKGAGQPRDLDGECRIMEMVGHLLLNLVGQHRGLIPLQTEDPEPIDLGSALASLFGSGDN